MLPYHQEQGTLSIDGYTLNGCKALASAYIPESVTEIGEQAFLDCSNLTLYGIAGSTAETYAKENSIPFVAVGSADRYIGNRKITCESTLEYDGTEKKPQVTVAGLTG